MAIRSLLIDFWVADCHNQSADWFRNDVEDRQENTPVFRPGCLLYRRGGFYIRPFFGGIWNAPLLIFEGRIICK